MIRFKSLCVRLLLRMLNTQFLNDSPCKYGYINNVDAFSYSNLASEEIQRPGITVKTIIDEADRFKSCPINQNGLTVIEADGSAHEATVWDRHELNLALSPKRDRDT